MDMRASLSQALNFSMMASVVANLSGLITGGLHLFLRSSCLSSFGPRDNCEAHRDKLKADIRIQKSDDGSDYYGYDGDNPTELRWSADSSNLDSARYGKGDEEEKRVQSPSGMPTYKTPDPLRSHAPYAETPQLMVPEPTQPSAFQALKAHIRKSSYSLFPRENKSFTLLPATTYSPNANSSDGKLQQDGDGQLLAPPPLVHDGGLRHRRDSSMGSHATVQIGLRFSNAEDAPPISYRDSGEVHNLGCPNERELGATKRPSPLAKAQTVDDGDDTLVGSSSQRESTKPVAFGAATHSSPGRDLDEPEDEPHLTLTAAVYNPSAAKTPRVVTSPGGAGFNRQKSLPPPPSPSEARCYKSKCNCDGLHKSEWI